MFNGFLSSMEMVFPTEKSDTYPFNLPVIKGLKTLEFHPKVTYIIGENGLGKSTLIEAIAINFGFNAEGGSKHYNFSSQDSHSSLNTHIKLTKGYRRLKDGFFLRSESFYNLANSFDDIKDEHFVNYYGGKTLHEQSHGEAFWTLFTIRFKGNGLYILDEPESALSVHRQLAMLARIHSLCENSQFIIATHSPIILAYPNSTIYELTEKGISIVKYHDTDIFKVSKGFINNVESTLDILFKETQ